MLTLYLACLIFGGILLTISLFSGGDADSDMDHSLDAHADVDMDHSLDMHADVDMDHALDVHADVDMDHALDVHADMDGGVDFDADMDMHADVGGGDVPAEIDVDAGHGDIVSVEDAAVDAHGGALHAAFEFFSFRNIVYMTTFFGMTGSVLTWLATPFALTLGSSVGMGFFAGMVGHRFMKYLRGSESGEALQLTDLIGHTGKVTLPPAKDRKGKVLVSTARENMELIALQHADSEVEELRPGDEVFILRVENNIVFVDRADFV